jgi:adenine phosphoribosyltransferase
MNETELKSYIRSIPDFPKPGIMFRDITPLLADPKAFQSVIDQFAGHYKDAGITAVVSAEARGFIFAAPLALALGVRFIPVRKPGKLPFETRAFHYELEYGTDSLEIHTDAITKDDTVLLIDDLLGTGGTMEACVKLVEHSEAKIAGCAFLIELDFLKGREKLRPHESFSLIHYADEN